MSNILQLIPSEALIYKTLIDGKIIRDAAEEAGLSYSSALMIVTRLIKFGVVTKTGHKKNFKCTAVEAPYEIVSHRNKPVSDYDPKKDMLIVKSLDIRLTDDQMYYLKNHKDVLNRTVLAKRLGLTKLQLNFLLLSKKKVGNKTKAYDRQVSR